MWEKSYACSAKHGSDINLCKASGDKIQETIEYKLVVGENTELAKELLEQVLLAATASDYGVTNVHIHVCSAVC